MALWLQWWNFVCQLRPAFSRKRSFLWFATIVAGISIRSDSAGVTSLVRVLGISPRFYQRLLDNMHTGAIKLDTLAQIWLQIVIRFFPTMRINGKLVLVGDGITVGLLLIVLLFNLKSDVAGDRESMGNKFDFLICSKQQNSSGIQALSTVKSKSIFSTTQLTLSGIQ
ncbi:MAG: hypothetical protein HYW48_01355 [Deltaproteobacteria bacterium]|nr:hypothetical protein [Deltaproteobacteria bacterium]